MIKGLLGALCPTLGSGLSVYLSVVRLFFGQPLGDRPLLLLAVLLAVLGVQLVMMGLLGELIVRAYHEAQGKTIYVVREAL